MTTTRWWCSLLREDNMSKVKISYPTVNNCTHFILNIHVSQLCTNSCEYFFGSANIFPFSYKKNIFSCDGFKCYLSSLVLVDVVCFVSDITVAFCIPEMLYPGKASDDSFFPYYR